MKYYEENAQIFIDTTLNLDMSDLYKYFEKRLTPGSRILDLGCGPGRDLKYFSETYNAIGIEPSPILANFARNYTKCDVFENSIQDFQTTEAFDGIWACASLLHIPSKDLNAVFKKLALLLNKNGIIYASFKYGSFEGERSGRYFTDMNESRLSHFLEGSDLSVSESWITSDLRAGRSDEKWLNVLIN